MTKILIDTDEFRIFYRQGRSDFLWVTFGYWGHSGERPWGELFADYFDYSILGFIDKRSQWFVGLDSIFLDVADILNRYPLRVAMGVSMGGYAAIKFSRALNIDIAYALVPQFSINPSSIVDFRYKHNFRPELHADMDIKAEDVAGQIYTLADPHFPFDMAQHALIEKIAEPTLIPSYFAGHLVAAAYRKPEVMGRAIDALIQRNAQALQRITLEGRKVAVERPLGTLCAAWTRHKQAARSILQEYGPAIAPDLLQNSLCDLSRELIALGHRSAAIEAIEAALAARPGNLSVELEYSHQLRSVDLAAAIRHARIAAASGDPEHIAWLEKLESEVA